LGRFHGRTERSALGIGLAMLATFVELSFVAGLFAGMAPPLA